MKPNGYRQFNTAYIEIPKKQGKSELAAAIALYLTCGDFEHGGEIYGCAADRQQASIVFDELHAQQMCIRDSFIQCEEAVSTYGLLGKHPTTGGAIASPFVSMSQNFQKQANLIWYEIFDIVKQNTTTAFISTPQDDMMERLLRKKKERD